MTVKQHRAAWLLISGLAVSVTALPTMVLAQGELPAIPVLAESDRLSDADLEEMLAPIALYPDTLLANTLAAAVFIDDLRAAFALQVAGRTADAATREAWDPTVQSIAEFPEVVQMLGEHSDWAEAIGQASILQGPDVMRAVQSLRARAWANGALVSNEKQTVVTEGTTIIIEPAQPQIIFVPRYNPQVVFVERPSSTSVVTAGLIGFGVGVVVTSIFWHGSVHWRTGFIHCGWGWGPRGSWNNNTNVNINVNNNNNNWNNVNVNRPGQGGQPWRPNPDRIRPSDWTRDGRRPAFNDFRGTGNPNRTMPSRVPGLEGSTRPIASAPRPPAPITRPGVTTRPSAPIARPSDRPGIPGTIGNRPNVPTTRPQIPETRPNIPTQRPNVPTQRPNIPTARPEQPVQRPSVPTNRPNVPAERPTLPTNRPAVPTQRPTAPTNRPTTPPSRPNVPATRPTPPQSPPSRPSGFNPGSRPSAPAARPMPSPTPRSMPARGGR